MTSSVSATSPDPIVPPEDDPFRYGWRDVQRVGPDGQMHRDRIPLTLEDVLHPREGDVIPENTLHNRECSYLKNTCRAQLTTVVGSLVLCDCLIEWGPDGPRDLSPDVAVLFNVADPGRQRGKFYVQREGTRPSLAIEIVSPDTRVNDVVRKLALYHQVGIPEYVIVDQVRDGGPRELLHYRAGPGGYVSVPLDNHGGVMLPVVRLRLCLQNNEIVCYDTVTGRQFEDYPEEHAARLAAEEEARRQTQAREDAERRLRELEAELRKLRQQGPPSTGES